MTEFNYALASLGAVATAEASDSGYPPVQTIDANDLTRWTASMNAGMKSLFIDLGAPQFITSIRGLAYRSSAQVGNWQLAYSSDGVNYNLLSVFLPNTGDTTAPVGGMTARYWRLRGVGSYWSGTFAGFYSVELWGPVEAPPPPVNPAPEYIDAWLDGIEANYVPTIDEWLAAH